MEIAIYVKGLQNLVRNAGYVVFFLVFFRNKTPRPNSTRVAGSGFITLTSNIIFRLSPLARISSISSPEI